MTIWTLTKSRLFCYIQAACSLHFSLCVIDSTRPGFIAVRCRIIVPTQPSVMCMETSAFAYLLELCAPVEMLQIRGITGYIESTGLGQGASTRLQCIRGFLAVMRYMSLRFTYLLTYLLIYY